MLFGASIKQEDKPRPFWVEGPARCQWMPQDVVDVPPLAGVDVAAHPSIPMISAIGIGVGVGVGVGWKQGLGGGRGKRTKGRYECRSDDRKRPARTPASDDRRTVGIGGVSAQVLGKTVTMVAAYVAKLEVILPARLCRPKFGMERMLMGIRQMRAIPYYRHAAEYELNS